MRADDVKPQGGIATDTLSFTSRASVEKPVSAESTKPVRDTIPGYGRAYTGAPKSPEGSGSGFNGLVRVLEETPYVAPTVGSSVEYDGSGTALSIPDANQTGLDLGNQFTIEFFYMGQPGIAGTRSFLSKWQSTNNQRQYDLFVNGGGLGTPAVISLVASANGTNETTILTSGTYTQTGTNPIYHWQHHAIAVDLDVGTVVHYVNGVIRRAQAPGTLIAIANGTAPFSIGYRGGDNDRKWNNTFKIREVRIWGDYRTQAEIISNMRRFNPAGDNLKALWRLGSNTQDSSGNGNHLTQGNGITFGTNTPFDNYGSTTRIFPLSGDGYVRSILSMNWDDIRGTAVGSQANYTGTNNGTVGIHKVFSGFNLYNSQLHRGFQSYDTGTANLGSVVGWHLYLQGTNSMGTSALGIVQATPDSGTELLTTDYDECGSLNNATEGAYRIGSASGGMDTDYQIVYFRGTQNGWINRAGTTHFGFRIKEDLDNNDVGDVVTPHPDVVLNTSEAGTVNGPFLDVVTVE